MPLADFINLITEEEDRTTAPHKIKNVLLYWDRGSLTSGDEAKKHFAHVIDVQQWFKDRFPKGENGNQKHSLGEAAVMMDVEFTTQDHLNDLPEEKHPYVEAPMKHCAGGDCFITLRVNVEIITRCIREMNAVDGRSRQIRSDYCFGGGRIGQGTTEGGVSRLFSADLEDCPEYYQHKIESRHSIVREMFNDHIGRKAQDGNMAIDNRKKRTYPRNNFHNGPNTTEKMKYWHQKHSRCRPELFEISIDTEVIGMAEMRNWVLQQLPTKVQSNRGNRAIGQYAVINEYDTPVSAQDVDEGVQYPEDAPKSWAILECIRGMEAVNGRIRKIRDDFCFIAIDFEGGGKVGKGTTEGGVSKLFSIDLFDYMENYVLKTETRHAIIREMFDDTIDRNGKIAIDNRQKATYPRSNFLGPNTTEKLEYLCVFMTQKVKMSTLPSALRFTQFSQHNSCSNKV
ncbi:unnamed protein product [Aureobasidium pullulans]|nr:unnamed protein product [Aureobasidium pullulans]